MVNEKRALKKYADVVERGYTTKEEALELMRAAKAGGEEERQALIEGLWPIMFKTVSNQYKLWCDSKLWDSAHDVIHAFIERKFDRVVELYDEERGNVFTSVNCSIMNMMRDGMRYDKRRKAKPMYTETGALDQEVARVEDKDDVRANVEARLMLDKLGELPEYYESAIRMRYGLPPYAKQYSYEEMAEEDSSAGRSGWSMRYLRGMTMLRKLMEVEAAV